MNDALFIMQQNFSGNIQKVCAKLSRLLATNEPQDAIEKIGQPNFPPPVIAMIKAGASAGSLPDALRDAADFEQEMTTIKKESGKIEIKQKKISGDTRLVLSINNAKNIKVTTILLENLVKEN